MKGEAWAVIGNRFKAKQIIDSKVLKVYALHRDKAHTLLKTHRDVDEAFKNNKRMGVPILWDDEAVDYKKAIELKELGYEVELELSCKLVIKNK